jgi:tol-pal system protein YbgF
VRTIMSGSLLVVMVAGCANTDLVVQRQTSLEGRLEQLAQTQSATQLRLTELGAELKALQAQTKKLVADQAADQEQQEKLLHLTRRVDKIETDLPPLQATRIEVVNKEAAAEDRDGRMQDAYLKAFGLFSANNFPAATEAFAAFIKAYPTSDYAVNARYWLGECFYSEGKYRQAIDAFSQLLTDAPAAKKVPDTMLKLGLSWLNLSEAGKGKSLLQTLIDKYPDSEAAGKARERLNRM